MGNMPFIIKVFTTVEHQLYDIILIFHLTSCVRFNSSFFKHFSKSQPMAKKCLTPLPNKIWNMKRRLNIFPPINFLQKSLKKMYERGLESWACLKMRHSSGSSLHFWSTLKSLYRGNATTTFLLLLGLIHKLTGKMIGSIFQGNTSRTSLRHKVHISTRWENN